MARPTPELSDDGRPPWRRAPVRVAPLKLPREPKGSIVDAIEQQVRGLLRAVSDMPATVLAGRIGWDRSIMVLKDEARELHPHYMPVDPGTRTTDDPGQWVRGDLWFPPAPVPVGFGTRGPHHAAEFSAWMAQGSPSDADVIYMKTYRRELDTELVHVARIAPLRWQAWSLALVNPRYGMTAAASRRRAMSDLHHEWATGRVPRAQRKPV